MKVPSIFEFEKFSPYFAAYFEWRKSVDPRFSYRWLERRIDSASYSMLAMIATGRRLPSHQLLKELSPILNLEEEERQYAELMVELEKSHSPSTREVIRAKMDFLRPSAQNQQSNFDHMMFLGDWHHTVILEMFSLDGFVADPVWIAEHLNDTISQQQAAASLELLRRLGLLEINQNGNYQRTAKELTTGTGFSKLAIKNFHKQFLDLAKERIMSDHPQKQHLSVGAITIPEDCFEAVCAEIDAMIERLRKQYGSAKGDATFQLTLQFIQLASSAKLMDLVSIETAKEQEVISKALPAPTEQDAGESEL
jgi:uncharacterized protein (TIGR02147 family)